MAGIQRKTSQSLLSKLPKRKKGIRKTLEQSIKLIQTPGKNLERTIVDETFAALPIKNHKLIKQVIEQVKYGE